MKNDDLPESIFVALRKKREDSVLPPGFDERFWKKFDRKYKAPSMNWAFFWTQRIGIPAFVLFFLVLWNFNQDSVSAFRDEEIVIVDPEVGPEDMDIAMHLDALGSSVDEDVWNNFVEGIENDQH